MNEWQCLLMVPRISLRLFLLAWTFSTFLLLLLSPASLLLVAMNYFPALGLSFPSQLW